MTDRWPVAVLLALLFEGRHWIPLRWEFNIPALITAWRLNCLLILAGGALIWFEGNRYNLMPQLLGWLPALLLPMQFVQSYGMAEKLPALVFSFFAGSRHRLAQKTGSPEPYRFHFGYAYFTVCLVAASQAKSPAAPLFLPGLLLLLAMLFLRFPRPKALAASSILLAAGVGAKSGQEIIERLEERYGGRRLSREQAFDPRVSRTNIGRRGQVTLSREIVWRLRLEKGMRAPRLLRTATFNQFAGSVWSSNHSRKEDFLDLDAATLDGDPYHLLQSADLLPRVPRLPYFSLRGAASEETPLPLPGDTAALRNFDLDGVERNPLGLVRIFPKESVIGGDVFWGGETNPEQAPFPRAGKSRPEDRIVAPMERPALDAVLAELEIPADGSKPAREVIDSLGRFFTTHFEYSLDLDIGRIPNPKGAESRAPTPLGQFLTTRRRGHCEYFATAAVLLFREAGIPARYATGFAVSEFDAGRREFVIRGSHRHAWCRVWDQSAGRWIDFDPTPPVWLANPNLGDTRMQRFNDWVKRVREDFFIWRNQPANRLGVTLAMTATGLALSGFIFIRLWRSRRRIKEHSRVPGYPGKTPATPLHAIEPRARRVLGTRPNGTPLARWLLDLRDRLPAPEKLDEALTLHQRMRFDPAAGEESSGRLGDLARTLERDIRALPALRKSSRHPGVCDVNCPK